MTFSAWPFRPATLATNSGLLAQKALHTPIVSDSGTRGTVRNTVALMEVKKKKTRRKPDPIISKHSL